MIELGLGRVREVAARLGCGKPAGPVFTVGGTNGKGSTVALLERFLAGAGGRIGAYTSPHLLAYNERIRIAGRPIGDDALVAAFERVERARGDTPLTFFEFGTLAALTAFREGGCDAWVLEVGMGGRLDAVNVIDTDYAIVTTVDLDHTEYLGDTVEEIAAEKAGILRPGRPGFYGDWPVPASLRRIAAERGAALRCLGEHFDFTPSRPAWSWRGAQTRLDGLAWPPAATVAQLRNVSVVLAALEQHDVTLVREAAVVDAAVAEARPPGRFQVVRREHEWILDVAHNRQAAATLRAQLDTLAPASEVSIVLGVLGDKDLDAFVDRLGRLARRWIACTVDDSRARSAASIAARLRELGGAEVVEADTPEAALDRARATTVPGGRIVVCGSFRVVGPALRWLGIY
jgi:dihydrofolate synthase/folylpolyglutamate synthase